MKISSAFEENRSLLAGEENGLPLKQSDLQIPASIVYTQTRTVPVPPRGIQRASDCDGAGTQSV